MINNGTQISHFIRTTISIPVTAHKLQLDYGLWVMVAPDSFKHYHEHFEDKQGLMEGQECLGYIANQLPGYNDMLRLRTAVIFHAGMIRPTLAPEIDQSDSDFAKAYYQGVSLDFAQARMQKIFDHLR